MDYYDAPGYDPEDDRIDPEHQVGRTIKNAASDDPLYDEYLAMPIPAVERLELACLEAGIPDEFRIAWIVKRYRRGA